MRTPCRPQFPSVIPSLCLALILSACGGGDVSLPPDGQPAAIAVTSGDEQSGRVGEPLAEPLVVQVTDSRGRPVEGATVAFEFSSAGPGASVVPQEKPTNGDGLADARLVLGTITGPQAGRARVVSGENNSTIQTGFSAMALSENANRMAAAAGQDQTGHVGQPLDDQLVVEVTDGFGNPVAGVPISWAAAGGGSVSEAVAVTGEDGRSRVERILGPTVGQQSTLASAEGLAGSPVLFVHTAVAGDAFRLTVESGNEQTGEAGALLPAALTVRLVDSQGNGVPDRAVTWVVATGGGSVSPQNSTTDGDGRTSAGWTLGQPLGEQRVDAVVSGLGFASFRATATAGAPASLFIRTQPSASARNGIRLARQPVIQLRDSRGNDVAAAGVQVTAALGGGGELRGTTRRSTDGSGRASFDDLSITGAAGRRSLVFTAPGYAPVTSSDIDLQAIGTTTTITGDSPDPSQVGAAFTVSFRVASEGPTPTGSVRVSDGEQDCTGSLSDGAGTCELRLNTAGNRTLTATYSGAPGLLGSSDTEGHTVTSDSPPPPPPPPPPAGTTTTITSDQPDPSIAGSEITVNFAVTSPAGTPTGSVTVRVSGSTPPPPCAVTLVNGTGSCRFTLNIPGQREFTATYSGAQGFAGSSDTEPHLVNPATPANEAPEADFASSCEGLTCQFTDESEDDDGNIVSWSWSFDGTGTSDQRNPSHTFPSQGQYEVTLTVTDDDGATDVGSRQVRVEAPNQPPTAGFTWDCDELDCDFEDQSTDSDGRIVAYAWTFGDGGTSDDEDPDHEYSSGGTYQVTLTVTDDDGATNPITQSVTVAAQPTNQVPTADINASCQNLSCTFTDQSSDPDNDIVSWTWDFGDGTSSGERNPSHTYASDGTYTVRLTVRDDNDASDDHTEEVTVAEPQVPGSLGVLTQPPSRTESGERLRPAPAVELLDESGSVMEVAELAINAAVGSGTATLQGPTTRSTDGRGRATFEELRIRGEQGEIVTLTFTASGFTAVDSQPILIQSDDDDDDGEG